MGHWLPCSRAPNSSNLAVVIFALASLASLFYVMPTYNREGFGPWFLRAAITELNFCDHCNCNKSCLHTGSLEAWDMNIYLYYSRSARNWKLLQQS